MGLDPRDFTIMPAASLAPVVVLVCDGCDDGYGWDRVYDALELAGDDVLRAELHRWLDAASNDLPELVTSWI